MKKPITPMMITEIIIVIIVATSTIAEGTCNCQPTAVSARFQWNACRKLLHYDNMNFIGQLFELQDISINFST
jgi:hypothetical protein